MPVGFIKIDDQIRGIAMTDSDHIRRKMRAFLVVEDRRRWARARQKRTPTRFIKLDMKWYDRFKSITWDSSTPLPIRS
jgi:hypothetical protein